MIDLEDISDEMIAAYIDGNATAEEIEIISSIMDYNSDIIEVIDVISDSNSFISQEVGHYVPSIIDFGNTILAENAHLYHDIMPSEIFGIDNNGVEGCSIGDTDDQLINEIESDI